MVTEVETDKKAMQTEAQTLLVKAMVQAISAWQGATATSNIFTNLLFWLIKKLGWLFLLLPHKTVSEQLVRIFETLIKVPSIFIYFYAATVASVRGDDLAASAASRSIDRKCVALDRYFKRLVRHPVVRKDAVFRTFLQEKEIPKTLKPVINMKSRVATFKERMSIFRSKVAVTERDPWFQV